jgi:uncharacterized FlaG/YvyC family protein
LSLATYNTVQISEVEATNEAQQPKTDLLANITKLQEQHLHKLNEIIDAIGEELKVVQKKLKFLFSNDRIIFQINSMKTSFGQWWPCLNASLSRHSTKS